MDPEPRENPAQSRYELVADRAVVGVAQYRERDAQRVFTHTEIAKRLRGKGMAERLVRFALDDTRAQAKTVVPECEVVKHFIDEHDEYADLVL
jgi:predicted GNAT family acetyltransferase